ncbi:PREDICTED: disks large homolog 5-like [Priapulus caudatus]|uniref:Disks large homolog 5-like n=1 Tax=Priapulus caudatus TaxID=37621 RepID=A0ABM1EYM1_PRICU|nr:PREDICTED: disks large homolog 5-like [Priapulus caudatus]
MHRVMMNPVGHNHSRDSAIDADLQEWETETLEFNMDVTDGSHVGFDVVGGRDDPQSPNDPSLFVSHVRPGGAADSKLRVNDCLVRVNNVDLMSVDQKMALQAVRSCGGLVNLVVRRRRANNARLLHSVSLHLSDSKDVGLDVESGFYVSKITLSSLAAKEGSIAIGVRIVLSTVPFRHSPLRATRPRPRPTAVAAATTRRANGSVERHLGKVPIARPGAGLARRAGRARDDAVVCPDFEAVLVLIVIIALNVMMHYCVTFTYWSVYDLHYLCQPYVIMHYCVTFTVASCITVVPYRIIKSGAPRSSMS